MPKRMVFGDDGSPGRILPGCGSTATTGRAGRLKCSIAPMERTNNSPRADLFLRPQADGLTEDVVQADPATRCTLSRPA